MMNLKVAIVGNPNVGKSSLFNLLTDNNIKIANWPGVTLDKVTGSSKFQNTNIEFIDLPGIYSLSLNDTASLEEKVTSELLIHDQYDLIVNVVDSANLARNLYLTLQLLELEKPMIMVLTKNDIAKKQRLHIDVEQLSNKLGIDVITANPRKNTGKNLILQTIVTAQNFTPNKIYDAYQSLEPELKIIAEHHDNFFSSIKFLEETIEASSITPQLLDIKLSLREKLQEDLDIYIPALRYEFITQIFQSAVVKDRRLKQLITEKIDMIALNKFFAIPLLALVMYAIFSFSIIVGGWFQAPFQNASEFIFITIPKSFLDNFNSLFSFIIADAIGGGISVVLTFVPVIFSLYLILAVIEDSGYMARGAFIIDKFMKLIGLSGKSFIPLILGFGCNVPAILSARILEDKKERIMTVMMTPFMSCGARLSVYAFFCAAFFQKSAYNIVYALYGIGVLVAILTGLALNLVLKSHSDNYNLIIELPRYHLPAIFIVFKSAWFRTKDFIFNAGKLIMVVFIILKILNSITFELKPANNNGSNSVIASISKVLTPGFHYMGIEKENWPAVVGIFTGIFAKEVMVGTLAAFYDNPIKQQSKSAIKHYFKNDVSAFAYLLFILLYFPCISVFAVIAKQIGIRWAIVSAVWSTAIAYIIATAFYQIAIHL